MQQDIAINKAIVTIRQKIKINGFSAVNLFTDGTNLNTEINPKVINICTNKMA